MATSLKGKIMRLYLVSAVLALAAVSLLATACLQPGASKRLLPVNFTFFKS
jgi:hypothetical protein